MQFSELKVGDGFTYQSQSATMQGVRQWKNAIKTGEGEAFNLSTMKMMCSIPATFSVTKTGRVAVAARGVLHTY